MDDLGFAPPFQPFTTSPVYTPSTCFLFSLSWGPELGLGQWREGAGYFCKGDEMFQCWDLHLSLRGSSNL